MTLSAKSQIRKAMRFAGLLVVGLAVLNLGVSDDPPVADPDPQRFEKEIARFEEWDRKNAWPDQPILFAGSSSIRMWKTHVSFPHSPVINRGFGGAHISDVIHFAEQVVLPYKPPVIAFYAGDNDVAGGKTAERVRDDYAKFTKLVHKQLPETTIIFLPIKPSTSRWKFWPEMRKANALIEEYSRSDERLLYVDLATPMLTGDDGRPPASLFIEDGLHLSEEGYRLWTKILMPVIDQCLAEKQAAGKKAGE